MKNYMPEGKIYEENNLGKYTVNELRDAMDSGKILEGRVSLCDREHNLHLDLGGAKGIIERTHGAIGIDNGSVKDIALISRVNKPVAFKVIEINTDEYGNFVAKLSRKAAQIECQKNYISKLIPGDIVNARVTHMEKFGAFVDIGCGINALIPIDMISISRIPHPCERFDENEDIRAVVRSTENGKITLSHRELLGNWEENANLFSDGETVPGIIRSIEDYGIFVELTPNLAGLAESVENVKISQNASVYIKSIIPERMKLKLVIVDSFEDNYKDKSNNYFINDEHIDYWRYSPNECDKLIETKF